MANAIKYVKVSDFYFGSGWYDAKSKMWFKKSDGIIELADDVDMTNISRYMKFNYLLDMTAKVKPEDKTKDTPIYTNTTPNQLMQNAYNTIEIVEEVEVEETIEEEISDVKITVEAEIEDETNREMQEEKKEIKAKPTPKKRRK